MKKRFSEEQIINILKETEAGAKVADKTQRDASQVAYYHSTLTQKMDEICTLFRENIISWHEYMSRIHEFNKLLFGFSLRIKSSIIEAIEITRNSILFRFSEPKIQMYTDGACRSAPFEIMNFGHYEPEEPLVYSMIQDGYSIFDIGAHIGWFSINFAVRYPNSKIFSFEPIKDTFEILLKNLEINNIKNINYFNYGFCEHQRDANFYYFKGGSVLASEQNLIDKDNVVSKNVHLKRLDEVVKDLKLSTLDFFKCDVEGSELFVIKGGISTIARFKPIIYIELYPPWCTKFGYSTSDVLDILAEYGYRCFWQKNGQLIETAVIDESLDVYNFFFLETTKHQEIIKKYTV